MDVKTMTLRELAACKRVAQNMYVLYGKKERIEKTIAKLQEDYEDVLRTIKLNEAGVVDLTGYTTQELLLRVKQENNSVKYIPNPEYLYYNEEKGVYEVRPMIEEEPINPRFE